MGTDDLKAALEARRKAAAPAEGPAPEPEAAPVAQKKPAAKRATLKAPTPRKDRARKAAAAPVTPPAAEPAAEPVAEEPKAPEEDAESPADPLAGLRRDEQPMKVQLGQRVSAETARRFRRFCAVQDLNQGDFLDLALREAIDRYSPKE